MKRPLSTAALILAMLLVSGCTIVDETNSTPEPSSAPSTASLSNLRYPEGQGTPEIRLTATVLQGNSLGVRTRHLLCNGDGALKGTDFADADAACAAVREEFPKITQDMIQLDSDDCKGTGDPSVADLFGSFEGKEIRFSLQRNNTCNVETWDKWFAVIGSDNG